MAVANLRGAPSVPFERLVGAGGHLDRIALQNGHGEPRPAEL